MIGKFVLVRNRAAGVHMGTLAESAGTAVILHNARRLHRWSGPHTLHEISLGGVPDEHTRISDPVEEILLTEALEVIVCTAAAQANLSRSRWAE